MQHQISNSAESVGDCCVCYDPLPIRSNHVFTACGHLFCVKCLLGWVSCSNKSVATCPICRDTMFVLPPQSPVMPVMPVMAVWPAWREHCIDRFIHDDDGIEWFEHADDDDDIETVPLSQREIAELREGRRAGVSMIRRHFYRTHLLTNVEFTGEIVHTFIPRFDYLEISNLNIGRGARFYEFVMSRRIEPQDNPCAEMNCFGYIIEIKVVEVRGLALQENQSWEATHEYCFVVEMFDPLWINGTPVADEGVIDVTACDKMKLRFSEIRRVYSVWPVQRADADA